MTHFLVLVLAGLIGAVAGLRALTAPAVVAWAAMLHWINLDGTWVQWLGHPITVAILTATTYVFGGLMREQVCTYMCPWPRIQGAMVDAESISVTYLKARGEPRGRHKKGTSWEGGYRVPMIAGQSDKYIVSALNQYKKGDRKHPTMRGIAASLSDQDMADLGAYYEQLGKSSVVTVADTPAVQPSAEVAGLLQKGACASCHGANFSKPVDPSYPKIAGQYADYLYVALKAYQTQGNPQVGRANAIMAGQVKQFKHSELKAMAQYIASLPGEVHTVSQPKFR